MAINELDEPIQDGSDDATNEAKVKGIVEQVRQDAKMGHANDTREELLARFAQSGVVVDDARLASLAQEIDGR